MLIVFPARLLSNSENLYLKLRMVADQRATTNQRAAEIGRSRLYGNG